MLLHRHDRNLQRISKVVMLCVGKGMRNGYFHTPMVGVYGDFRKEKQE